MIHRITKEKVYALGGQPEEPSSKPDKYGYWECVSMMQGDENYILFLWKWVAVAVRPNLGPG